MFPKKPDTFSAPKAPVVKQPQSQCQANNHRKLMPTNAQRMVWGFGDGSGLNVVDTPGVRVGALIYWKNYMPLALCVNRTAMRPVDFKK